MDLSDIKEIKKDNRNYGIDLLRIISMFMIIILHILGNGGILENSQILSLKNIVAWFVEIFCYSAVNIYAMISGFVMINSKFKLKRIIEFWIQVVFYSFGITLIFYLATDKASIKNIIKSLMPISREFYWYATAYFGMYFFVNFINKFLNNLNKIEHKKLLITIFVLISIFQTFTISDSFGTNNGYSMIWLIFMYMFGAYIKKYGIFENKSNKILSLYYLGTTILVVLSYIIIAYTTTQIIGKAKGQGKLINYISPFILINGILAVRIFKNLNFNNNIIKRGINIVSRSNFWGIFNSCSSISIFKYNGKEICNTIKL